MKGRRIQTCPRAPARLPAPRKINPRRGGILCSLVVNAADPALVERLSRDASVYFVTTRCVVEEGPDIRWNAYDTNHFITQTAVAPRFARAAAKLHLRKIVDRLAREYGLGEDQMGVECVFSDVFPLETVGGAQ